MRGFLWFLLFLILFHRPIVHYGGRWAAIWFAKKQHLDVDLKISGNLWSHFEITGVKVRADGTGPAPLDKLDLDRVALDYDVLKLIRGDLNGLASVEVGTVDVVVPESKEPPKKEPSGPLAETLRGLLKTPLPAPKVQIGRVDLRVKNSTGDIVARNFRLSFLPGAPGVFGWDRVEVPGLKPIGPFAATTKFSSGNLTVERPAAGADNVLVALVVKPAGQAGAPDTAGNITAELRLLGLRVNVEAAPAATGNNVRGAVQIADVNIQQITQALGIAVPVAARVPKVSTTFSGDPEKPESWDAGVDLTAFGDGPDLVAGSEVKAKIAFQGQTLELSGVDINVAGAHVSAHGKIPVPPALLQGGGLPALESGALDFTVDVPDLAAVGQRVKQPLAGKAQGTGRLELDKTTARLSFDLDGDGLAFPPAAVKKTSVKVRATQSMLAPQSLKMLVATVEAQLKEAGTKEVLADDVAFSADVHDLHAVVKQVRVARGQSTVEASAEVTLDETGKLKSTPTGKFSVNVPALADFQLAVNNQPLTGVVTGNGEFVVGQPIEKSSGKVYVRGSNLRLGDADVGSFEVDAHAADGLVKATRVDLKLAGQTTLSVHGQVAIAEPHAYTGKVALNAPDLSGFKTLLEALGQKLALAGQVQLDVEGEGDLVHPTGTVRVAADKVKVNALEIGEARFAAKLTPDTAETSEMYATIGKIRAAAQLHWKDKRVALSDVDVKLDGTNVLSGSVSAPLDPQGKRPLPDDQPIDVRFAAKELDVAKMLTSLGQPAQAGGTVSVDLAVGGTLAQPTLKLDVKGTKLRQLTPPPSPAEKAKSSTVVQPSPKPAAPTPPAEIPPTDLEAHVTLAGNDVKLNGIVKQPLIQPLTFSGGTTVNVKNLLDGQPLDPKELPISADVNLPASKLDFLPRLVPALAKIEGTAAIALKARGTVGKPELDGGTTLDLKVIRLSNGAAPLVTNFKARVAFAGDKLSFPEFGGELGGGKFALKGSIALAKPAEPEFDLGFTAKDVLLMRDDSVLVRADTDVTLRGPLKAAEAKGTVYVVSSRFNKEIEILPLSLPGKPKPVPKVAASGPVTVSFPDPPLRDWKFDIAIKTRADDPFLVRGNLARGQVMIDLQLAGTGLQPYLTGAVTIEQFNATLPMSKLTTRRGVVTFSQDSPFQPYVELEAETVIRQYTVVARVTGPATKPELDLESEPPLPQQEILSLLTTGSLTGEIGANNTALATRAAILVVKQWYKKIFKKNAPMEEENKNGDSILDRFEVDFGAVDPKTGRNETTAQVRLTDKFYLIGDLEMGGGYSGRVKYLLRFK